MLYEVITIEERIGANMLEKLKVGIIGGTGMVGQRFVQLLDEHPWFEVVSIAASGRSAGKTYEESVHVITSYSIHYTKLYEDSKQAAHLPIGIMRD